MTDYVKQDDQVGRLAAAARALGAYEGDAAFRAKLALIARPKPKIEPPEAAAKKPAKVKRVPSV